MTDCTEVKIKLSGSHGLLIKKNEKGIDSSLIKSLDEAKIKYKNEAWLPLLIPPKTDNQERLKEFAESRRCLLEALKKINPRSDDEIHISLSHTKNYSAAFAVTSDEGTIEGVGIDIESKDREIKPDVKKKFIFDFEERLNLTPLELWTIKEASFKANSNRDGDKDPGTLFQFEIEEYDPDRQEGTTFRAPDDSTSFQMYFHENLVITIALAP